MTLEFVQITTITFRHFAPPENQYPTMTHFKGVALEMFGTWNSSAFVDFTEFFNAEWLRMPNFKAKTTKCTRFLFPSWRSLNPLQGHLTIPTKTSLRYRNENKKLHQHHQRQGIQPKHRPSANSCPGHAATTLVKTCVQLVPQLGGSSKLVTPMEGEQLKGLTVTMPWKSKTNH